MDYKIERNLEYAILCNVYNVMYIINTMFVFSRNMFWFK